jgi:hypothetical protein
MVAELSMFNSHKMNIGNNEYQLKSYLDTYNEDRNYYNFSFKSRFTAELEYKLLGAVFKDSRLNDEQRASVGYDLMQTKHQLRRDAELAGNTHEAKAYQDPNQTSEQDAAGVWQRNKLSEDLRNLGLTFTEINKVIGWLSFLNIYRLIGTFARLSWTMVWTIAAECHLLDDQNALFGHPINRDILTTSTTVFNALSVLLFAARWLSHIAMIIKHVACPTDAEKAISPLERGLREFYTRMSHICNDTVWGIMNMLTNYPQLWGISVATANTMMLYTIVFDLTWLCVQWGFKEWELNEKYNELMEFRKTLSQDSDASVINEKMLLALADEQLETRARFGIQIFACLLIIVSFASVLALTSVAAAPIGFLACLVGFSMYLSSDEFAAYWRSFYAHDRVNSSDPKVQAEQQEARVLFFKTLSKAALVPTLLVGMYTISWPLAVVMTVLYAAYENYGPKSKSQEAFNEAQRVSYQQQVSDVIRL